MKFVWKLLYTIKLFVLKKLKKIDFIIVEKTWWAIYNTLPYYFCTLHAFVKFRLIAQKKAISISNAEHVFFSISSKALWLDISGDLERLRRYWMTGSCKPGKEVQKSSDPLALEQFLSAFLLLMAGIVLAAVLLLLEHLYFKYVRHHLARSDRGGCCALISLVSFETYCA